MPLAPTARKDLRDPKDLKRGTLSESERGRLEGEMAAMRVEAGLDPPSDHVPYPAAGYASGELKGELAKFVSVELCARDHAVRDPLVAEAVDAVGYDTIVLDACRGLAALKAEDPALCRGILASGPRQQCAERIAIAAGNPQMCPVFDILGGATQRDPACLARAMRDPRLCAAAPLGDRTTCRALANNDPKLCDDERCRRQVSRWGSLGAAAPTRQSAAIGTVAAVTLRIELLRSDHVPDAMRARGDAAGGDASDVVDGADAGARVQAFAEIAEGGGVVHQGGGRTRITLGNARNALWFGAFSPAASPHFYLELAPDAWRMGGGGTSAHGAGGAVERVALRDAGAPLHAPWDRIDLVIPQLANLSSAGSESGGTVEFIDVGNAVGGALKLRVEAILSDPPRMFRITIDVDTYIRDWIETTPRRAP